jgi:transposase
MQTARTKLLKPLADGVGHTFDRTPAIAGGPRKKPRYMPMSDTFSKVEVITGVARRRRFSTELKLAVVAEAMQPGMSISYVARRHGLSPALVFRWRRLMSESGKEAVRADEEVGSSGAARSPFRIGKGYSLACFSPSIVSRSARLMARRCRRCTDRMRFTWS